MSAVNDLLPYVNSLKGNIDRTLSRFGTNPPVSWGQLCELVEQCQLADRLLMAAYDAGLHEDERVKAYAEHVENHKEMES